MSGMKSITLIAGLVCMEPHGGGAVWGFVEVLVVLDSAHAGWISGGRPSHRQEHLITSASRQTDCLQRDDK